MIAVEEGPPIPMKYGGDGKQMVSRSECEDLCNAIPECGSITYCAWYEKDPKDGGKGMKGWGDCHMKSKVYDGSMIETKPLDRCTTLYKKSKGQIF